MKKNRLSKLLKFGILFFGISLLLSNCEKETYNNSLIQEKNLIKFELKDKIENNELKNNLDQDLSKIEQIFNASPPKSMSRNYLKNPQNKSNDIQEIKINTEAFNIIENENGTPSYTFEIDFPTDSIDNGEIINLHTYYNENNELKSLLLKYELTNEELQTAITNQSFDDYWDKIYFIDLDSLNVVSNSVKTMARGNGGSCYCQWYRHPWYWAALNKQSNNNSNNYSGGYSYSTNSYAGVPYSLPPLNSLPPSVTATLKRAGIYTGNYTIGISNVSPSDLGYNNYSAAIRYFSKNDLKIPNKYSASIPFGSFYYSSSPYFSKLKYVITNYYQKVYVPQISSYMTSTQISISDHNKKQAFINTFFKFLYSLNSSSYNYLANNNELTETLFLFLQENSNSYSSFVKAEKLAKEATNIMVNPYITEVQKFEQYKVAYNNFDPILPINVAQDNYEAKIRSYIAYFKRRGNHEFANYLETLLPLDNSFSKEDYIKLYETIREQKLNYFYALLKEIGLATFDAFKPVIEMALWEVGGGVALKVLSKLPIKYLTTPIKNVITRLKTPTSTGFTSLKHAKKYGIQSYKKLGDIFKELGISAKQLGVEKHHLFEKRFAKNLEISKKLGKNTDDWLSIVVEKTNKFTQSEHYKFTQAWKNAIGYEKQAAGTTGFNTNNVPYETFIKTAQDIYKNYPEILKALGI